MLQSHVRPVWWLLCFLILGVGTSPLIAVAHAPIEEIHPTRPKLPVEPNRERLNPAAAHLAGTGKFQTPEDLRAQQALLQRDESAGHIAEGTWRQAQPALLVHDLFTEAGPVTKVETRNQAWSDDQQRSAQQLAHRIALKAMEEVMAERPEGAAAADAAVYKQRLIDTLKDTDRPAAGTIDGGVWAKVLDKEFPSTRYKTRVYEPGSQLGALQYRVDADGLPRTSTSLNVDRFAAKAAGDAKLRSPETTPTATATRDATAPAPH